MSFHARTIPANALNLVEDKQAAALAAANGGTALPPFVEFNKAIPTEPKAPSISVFRQRTRDIRRETGEGGLTSSVSQFFVSIALVNQKPGRLMELLEIYVDAVHGIIMDATDAEMLIGFPETTVGPVFWDITEHVFGPDVPEGNMHARAASLILLVRMKERG